MREPVRSAPKCQLIVCYVAIKSRRYFYYASDASKDAQGREGLTPDRVRREGQAYI